MGWRFRKVFKLLPGLKLNLTPRGISATVGAAPFSLNVGPRGVYRNLSIPGTGIWDRRRLDVPSKHSQEATTHKDLDQERVERIEMLRKWQQAIKEYGEAHAKLVRLNAAPLFGGKGGETVFPAKKFMEYQLVVSAFFAAAKHHEQRNGIFLPASLIENFTAGLCSWKLSGQTSSRPRSSARNWELLLGHSSLFQAQRAAGKSLSTS
jgi:hypothetical protein